MKIFKTFYKPQTATLLKETIHPPPPSHIFGICFKILTLIVKARN